MDKEKENIPLFTDGKAERSVIIVGSDRNVSLQDSFKRFLDQKKKERHIQKICREGALAGGKRTEAFKDMLRMKFVDGAKSYLGVPYAERYKAPDVPTAPLYLDCCGLIRQVVKDLQSEFGFVIGRWNQCYQMDTLPIILEFEQLRPGDLIFYEGTYVSNRSKPQKHNNVHVEIFLGGETGEATIGSRYHKAAGKRSIFHDSDDDCAGGPDDDSQLQAEEDGEQGRQEGDNDSCYEAGRGADGSSDDGSGGGDDDGGDDDIRSAPNVTKSAEEEEAAEASEFIIAAATDLRGNVVSEATGPNELRKESVAIDAASRTEPPSTTRTKQSRGISSRNRSSAKSASTTTTATAAKSSRSGILDGGAESMPEKKNKSPSRLRVPSGLSVSVDRLELATGDGVAFEGVKGIEQNASTGGGEAAGRILGGKAAAASGKGKRVGAAREGMARSMSMSLDSEPFAKGKASSGIPRTYFVCKSNGWPLVKAALDKRGWQQLPFDYNFSARYGLKWVERRSHIDYRAHEPGQLVCHIPNNDIICTKLGLLLTLRDSYCRVPPGSARRLPTPWLPETYQLDSPADVAAALAVEDSLLSSSRPLAAALVPMAADSSSSVTDGATATAVADASVVERAGGDASCGCIWIYKPSCNNRGRGIRVFRGRRELEEVCRGKATGDPDTSVAPLKGIVQRYIEDPLLVGPSRLKFDVRCYMLIARNHPSYMVFYHPGYCRLTLKSYSTDPESLSDPSIHLTNAAVQKKDPLYKDNKEDQIQSLSAVADLIEATGNEASAVFMRGGPGSSGIDHEIKRCMVDVIKAAAPKFLRKHGFFDLLGFDFMVTDSNKLVLLEINTNPAMSLDNSTLENLLPGVIDGTIQLVLDLQGPDRPPPTTDSYSIARDQEVLTRLPGSFELIMDEQGGFYYGGAGPG